MAKACTFAILVAMTSTLSVVGRSQENQSYSSLFSDVPDNRRTPNDAMVFPEWMPELPGSWTADSVNTPGNSNVLISGHSLRDDGAASKSESAKFANAYQIPDSEIWWKFGGFIKADFIHDFEPAGTLDRFVPNTIPINSNLGPNSLMQAKATRLNLDVRKPTDWGIARGFLETDFFTADANLRIRHAYAEVGPLLAGQTWTTFTDPDGIPRTLDLESPVAFIILRQTQFRWTESLRDDLTWAIAIENPKTSVDDIVTLTIPGVPEQPTPDFITHLKYKDEHVELFVAGMLRELAYLPNNGVSQNHIGWAANVVGISHLTKDDKVIGQLVIGEGLGRYRSGSDLGLDTATTVDTILDIGGCLGVTHNWTKKLSSTGVYSFAMRRANEADPPNTPEFASYTAVNLIWEPIDRTTIGIEYLFGTKETQNGEFGSANRIQMSVQYNFP